MGLCRRGFGRRIRAVFRVGRIAAAVLAAGMLLPALEQQAAAERGVGRAGVQVAVSSSVQSANVAALQAALRSYGLYRAAVDGIRGPLTRAAVVRFQRSRGLAADGIAGPVTRRALGRRGRPSLGARTLRRGHAGWDVAALQYLLARRGYPPGAIDGAFGIVTGSALRNYQSAAGLTVDELAGPATIASLRAGSTPGAGAPQGPVRFLRPVAGRIGDGYGAPRDGGRRIHTGIDFEAPWGARVGAAGVGVTEFVGLNQGGYGHLVAIRHRLGFTTWYAHLSSITTWVGERVTGGTRIGYVGSTGYSTGPHLHFEARRYGTPIDPAPYLLAAVAADSRGRRSGGTRRCSGRKLLVSYRRARIDAC
jgi:murein DD-endopeptidase MepM/ murein hydrolase activator NlpD